jgi:hypothetical protein
MNFMDGLLLTLINTIICIGIPAFLSVIANKRQNHKAAKPEIISSESRGKISRAIDAV